MQNEQIHNSYKNCNTSNMEYFKGLSHVETRKINWRLSYLDLNKQEQKGEIFGVKTFFQDELVQR